MEQIETQASDLRFLATAPVPLSNSHSISYETPRPGTHASPAGSASFGDNSASQGDGGASANKRKSIDDGGASAKQTRSKRNRYISIACNECKRRKIKCNGETPCNRCGNLNLACLYAPNCCSTNFKDSDEYKTVTSQLNRLQDEVNWLNQAMRNMQNDPSRLAVSNDRNVPASVSAVSQSPAQSSSASGPPRSDHAQSRPQGAFKGPTSTAFNLDIANTTISNMGYKGMADLDAPDLPPTVEGLAPMQTPYGVLDPIMEFSRDEMIRLCRLHEEETGIMYPVLDIQVVIAHARNLATYLESVRGQRLTEAINDQGTLQLKMIMCCALVVEENGPSEKAQRLYDSMEAVVNRKLMADGSDISSLPLLCLLAGYRFLSNDEVLAWRVMGQVCRLCLESGLHQKHVLMGIENNAERRNALTSFWSAYVLDRRWAFATGLPYTIHDEEIDPELPFPEEYPYLVAMITYSRIGAKVWRQVAHSGPVLAREQNREEIDRLDREILQWYETVPEEVKVRNWDKERQMTSTPSYNLQRLRIWTYLRFNQIRIWLYTPILHSATSIMKSPNHAQRVVDLAKDTIRYLSHLNNTTNLYRRAQTFYHQFLSSAISVVFLASVHAPVRFSPVCREEFYMGLDLVRDLSAKSWVSKRLWRTIKSLKDVAPRFGLKPDEDPHSSAAWGMVGLARGHVEDPYPNLPMPPGQRPPENSEVDKNGAKIHNEMARIFEGYVSLNGFQYGEEPQQPNQHGELTSPNGQGMVFGSDGTVFPHLREMF